MISNEILDAFMDDDDELAAICKLICDETIYRKSPLYRKRWDSHYLRHLAVMEGSFIAEYRLAPKEFDCLHQLLASAIEVNQRMARVAMQTSCTEEISVASRLGIALIMLGGGRRTEAMRTHGVSRSSCYAILHQVVSAINNCPALEINGRNDILSLQSRAAEFKKKSTHGLFEYCVGAIDGLAIRIAVPSRSETKNQTAFYSGSKKFYCVNLQGICDANREFVGVSCKCTGGTNDVDAFGLSDLKAMVDSLPFPYHINGDGAYVVTETVMTPFGGINLHITYPSKDSFNFWHSQLRINIECAFGMFIQRWGIFWRPLQFSLKNAFAIIHACIRLHNFCVQRRLPAVVARNVQIPSIAMVDQDGVLIDDIWRAGAEPSVEWRRNGIGSCLRDAIVKEIEEKQLFHSRNFVGRRGNN